jgi:ferredoxin
VFENRVLRTIFGTKREEVTGNWRKLHSEMGGACGTCRVLVGKPKGKRPLGKFMLWW